MPKYSKHKLFFCFKETRIRIPFSFRSKLSKYRHASIVDGKEVSIQICHILHCIKNTEALCVTQNYSPSFLFSFLICVLWLRCPASFFNIDTFKILLICIKASISKALKKLSFHGTGLNFHFLG